MMWGGSPASIISAAEANRILIVVSEEIVREISKVLAYPQLREIYEGAGITREELIEAVLRIGKMVDVKTEIDLVAEDPDDNKFLECAIDGQADYVVSGDEHLLRIRRYEGIQITSVNQFIKQVKEYAGQRLRRKMRAPSPRVKGRRHAGEWVVVG